MLEGGPGGVLSAGHEGRRRRRRLAVHRRRLGEVVGLEAVVRRPGLELRRRPLRGSLRGPRLVSNGGARPEGLLEGSLHGAGLLELGVARVLEGLQCGLRPQVGGLLQRGRRPPGGGRGRRAELLVLAAVLREVLLEIMRLRLVEAAVLEVLLLLLGRLLLLLAGRKVLLLQNKRNHCQKGSLQWTTCPVKRTRRR